VPDSQRSNGDRLLGDLLDEYLKALPAKDRLTKGQWVAKYVEYIGRETPVGSLDSARVQSYAESQLSPQDPNVQERVQALKHWFKFLHKGGHTPQNFGTLVRVPRAKNSQAKRSAPATAERRVIKMTSDGVAALRAELEQLERERVELVRAVAQAREDKDFRENAPLHAAREALAWNEQRRREIEAALKDAVIVEDPPAGQSAVGSKVTVTRLDSGQSETYVLVSPHEASPRDRKISVESPVGRALLGRRVGEEIAVDIPRGRIEFRIDRIE